ncbi:antitoxin of toxin-antitoxin stability system [Rheinheimera baltica]|jgi:antitoxin StbD|uniref:antitoxin of toxin-antitoxin stability system n=1 Tax=Rheinheimera baltica TaxID=67576 RepID=UPI00068556FB|nr:antitoxin of toxin-antitoxin stability system [Rheinheimera baltica]
MTYATKTYGTPTISIGKFITNPTAALAEAKGDAIAVLSDNQIQFYAVPASLFEEMTAFCEFAQRGTTSLKHLQAKFTAPDIEMEKLATEMAKKLKR